MRWNYEGKKKNKNGINEWQRIGISLPYNLSAIPMVLDWEHSIEYHNNEQWASRTMSSTSSSTGSDIASSTVSSWVSNTSEQATQVIQQLAQHSLNVILDWRQCIAIMTSNAAQQVTQPVTQGVALWVAQSVTQ